MSKTVLCQRQLCVTCVTYLKAKKILIYDKIEGVIVTNKYLTTFKQFFLEVKTTVIHHDSEKKNKKLKLQ